METYQKWIGIILVLLSLAGVSFGVWSSVKKNEEEARRVKAQNELAKLSEVMKEKENSWSRLSQQQEDLINLLKQRDSKLVELIEKRDEQILVLSDAIVKFRPTTIVIKEPSDINQSEQDDRTKVEFQKDQDKIRVSGFTLTNPPEAEINFSFIEPLKLRTVVTQSEDGSWRTYLESDWDGLEIENIDTVVNPLPLKEKSFLERFSVGISAHVNSDFDTVIGTANILYDFDSFEIGPSVSYSIGDSGTLAPFGLMFQVRPF